MNLLHLQYFYTVAREGGFTKASQALRVQQPSISRMVKQLEDNLNIQLFERRGRNVVLTPQGEEIYQRCEKIFGEVSALRSSLNFITAECRGSLNFGAAEPIASHFVPNILAQFLKKHPKVYPLLYSGPASALFDKIANSDLEFGLFFHTPKVPANLELTPLCDVPFKLVIQKEKLRDRQVIQSFIGSREIDDRTTKRFPTIERMRRDYPDTRIRISSNNLTAHKQMVLQGLGVSILPEFLVQKDLKLGRLAELYPKEKFVFQLKLVQRRNYALSLNAQTICDYFRHSSELAPA